MHTDTEAPTPYFYVHDRLGSVRLVVGYNGTAAFAANAYTYTPFGQVYDGQCIETVDNPWQFTGQWYDEETDQYYLRARMYDPTMMRFTSRDPVYGIVSEPLTLHKYLYCLNNPVNRIDPAGTFSFGDALIGAWYQAQAGAITGAAFGVVNELFTSLLNETDFNWGNVGKSAGYGMLAGGLAGALYHGTVGIELVGMMPKNFFFSLGCKILGGGAAASVKGVNEMNAVRNVGINAIIADAEAGW